jgi:peptidoglycan-N-acetylglucosamine deacetylase
VIVAHLVAVALLAWPGRRRWAFALALGSHAILGAFGLWPRSQVLGRTLVRLPPGARDGRVALTFDDGPDPEVTPLLLDVLDRFETRASFFLIGTRARAHPALVRDIVRRGHAVENHTLHHSPRFALMGLRALRREVSGAQAVLAAVAGHPPRFVRAPIGLRNPLLDPVLASLGLDHVSWSRRGYDTRCRDPGRVLRGLLRGLRPGDVLLLHDGNAARTTGGVPVVLEVVPPLLSRLAERGLRAVPIPRAAMRGREAVRGSRASAARASR